MFFTNKHDTLPVRRTDLGRDQRLGDFSHLSSRESQVCFAFAAQSAFDRDMLVLDQIARGQDSTASVVHASASNVIYWLALAGRYISDALSGEHTSTVKARSVLELALEQIGTSLPELIVMLTRLDARGVRIHRRLLRGDEESRYRILSTWLLTEDESPKLTRAGERLIDVCFCLVDGPYRMDWFGSVVELMPRDAPVFLQAIYARQEMPPLTRALACVVHAKAATERGRKSLFRFFMYLLDEIETVPARLRQKRLLNWLVSVLCTYDAYKWIWDYVAWLLNTTRLPVPSRCLLWEMLGDWTAGDSFDFDIEREGLCDTEGRFMNLYVLATKDRTTLLGLRRLGLLLEHCDGYGYPSRLFS